MDRSRRLAVLLAAALVAAGCTSDDGPEVATAEVTRGEVVQTVAAVASLEPAGRVAVTAPVGGDIAELLVADGDEVSAGDPIARLTSDGVELQIAQAEAAVAAADALGGAAGGAGLDLSPVFGAFAGQLDATLPPVFEALDQQVAAIEDPDLRAAAQERVDDAYAAYADASGQLRAAERDAASQAEAASAAQREAAAAQRRQAELALEAARDRGDDLTVVAPADGVVELARDGGGGGLPDLGGLAGQLGGDAAGLDPSALLGDAGGALEGGDGGGDGGPITEGVGVGAGQVIATVFDLSSFTARVDVDEIDVVDVEDGQGVDVLVDAFPDAVLRGRVTTVALTPTTGATGGSIFPVTVQLVQVPDDVRLRVGLTASAEIEVRRVDGETVVPTAALLRRGGQEVVFVVDGERVREVPVDVVALGEQDAAIDGELTAGDQVVTTGVELVGDGDAFPP